MRAGLLGQPLRRPLGIFQVPGRGELESSVIVVWISLGYGYRAKNILDLDQPTCLVTRTLTFETMELLSLFLAAATQALMPVLFCRSACTHAATSHT
jgi:hypothetical protein